LFSLLGSGTPLEGLVEGGCVAFRARLSAIASAHITTTCTSPVQLVKSRNSGLDVGKRGLFSYFYLRTA